ncbi:MAG: hypothetical protein ACHQ2Z_13515, partial [Elusimicrobiota bacterium]
LQALRQKSDGHETHIDSLRAELETAREQVAEREAELREVREKSRVVLENAEAIRREGVEAFENTREMKIRLELEEGKRSASARPGFEPGEIEALKGELRDRAERESRELRDALEAERKRLYQDLEVERRAQEAAPPSPPSAEERVRRVRGESDERREDIEREVRGYLTPEPKPAESAPLPSSPEDAAPVPAQAAKRPETQDPSRREPWQTRDEMKFLLWIAVGVGVVAVLVACALFFQG